MKKSLLMPAGCATLLLLSSAAAWAAPGPYLSMNGGVAILDDGDAKGPKGTVEMESDPGLALAGAAGYDFGNNLRLEAEVGYQKNDLDKVGLRGGTRGTASSGDTSSVSGLLNGYYDFVNQSRLTPFVSAGVGVMKVSLSDLNLPGTGFDEGLDGTAVAWQAGGGVSYAVNYGVAVDLKYRYMNAVDLEVDGAELDYSGHNVYGGIRASF